MQRILMSANVLSTTLTLMFDADNKLTSPEIVAAIEFCCSMWLTINANSFFTPLCPRTSLLCLDHFAR